MHQWTYVIEFLVVLPICGLAILCFDSSFAFLDSSGNYAALNSSVLSYSAISFIGEPEIVACVLEDAYRTEAGGCRSSHSKQIQVLYEGVISLVSTIEEACPIVQTDFPALFHQK